MTTREERLLTEQVLHFLNSCQRDLVDNARSYKAELESAQRRMTDEQQAAIAKADGENVRRLLDRVQALLDEPTTAAMVESGCGSLGVAFESIGADLAYLRAAGDAQATGVTKMDAATVAKVADATLAAVPELVRLY
jgi:hypothetical protein